MGVNHGYSKISTSGLTFAYDTGDKFNSYIGEPTTNAISALNAYPSVGNSWGTYNTNQYNGGGYFSIGTISSVSSNIVTTTSAHPLRSFDVVRPQTTGGGGVSAGTDYVIKKISSTQFSIHNYNGSQDGSQGYINPSTGFYKVHDDFANDNRVSINSTSFPTMWWGAPHLPNSGLIKEIISNGFDYFYPNKTDCIRLHWYRPDGVTDGMAYGVYVSVTNGVTYTVSCWMRAVDSNAVGASIYWQYYNGGNGSAGSNSLTMGPIGVWQQLSITLTASASGNVQFYWFPPGGNMTIDVSNIQFEQNSHATAFSSSSRSVTQGLIDISGQGNTIDLTNMSYDSSSRMVFNGTSNYIPITRTSALSPTAGITQECIINMTTVQDMVFIGLQYNSLTSNSYALWYEGGLFRALVNIAGFPQIINFSQVATANMYYHFVHTWDGTTQKLYLNNVLVNYISTSGTIVYDANNTQITIGTDNNSGYNSGKMLFVAGYMPVVKIYNRGLTQAEVTMNYNHYKNRFNLS